LIFSFSEFVSSFVFPLLLGSNFLIAQSKLYYTDNFSYSSRQIAKFQNGKIYYTHISGYSSKQIGKVECNKIFFTDNSACSARQVGEFIFKKHCFLNYSNA